MTSSPRRLGPFDFRNVDPDDPAPHHGVPLTSTADLVPVDRLHRYYLNARRGNVPKIARSLARLGQYRSIVVNRGTITGRADEVLAGNHTWLAATSIAWTHIGVEWCDVDEETAATIVAIDNKSNDDATYDDPELLALLEQIKSPDLAETSGFTQDERDALLAKVRPAEGDEDDVDDVPPPPADPVTVKGDVWLLGPHRVICGDCRDPDVVRRLIGDRRVNLAFTSPPYADARKYDPSSGFVPIPPEQYVEWFAPVAANVAEHLADDGSWFVNMKAKADGLDTPLWVLDTVIAHARAWGWHYATEFCWERVGMPKVVKTRFKNQFEPVYQFARGPWKMRPEAVQHPSDDALKGGGKGSGNSSWAENHDRRSFSGPRVGPGMAYPGNRLPPFQSSGEGVGHTAAFPVGLPTFFIRAYTDRGDIVYDPFLGGGTTLVAADREGRVGYGCELSPAWCDVICKRYQDLTGTVAVREADGAKVRF